MYTFDDNWKFQEKYLPEIQDILLQYSFLWAGVRLGTALEDKQQATDSVGQVFEPSFAVRIRRGGYLSLYKDLTIRSVCRGYRTEIDKLKAGYGDYYLYCWTDEQDKIASYWLIDLNRVRDAGLLDRPTAKNNGDGTGFIVIKEGELEAAGAFISTWDKRHGR